MGAERVTELLRVSCLGEEFAMQNLTAEQREMMSHFQVINGLIIGHNRYE